MANHHHRRGGAARLGDVQDAAALLKVSRKTIRRQADLRKLGVIRMGPLLRFDLALLGEWLDQRTALSTFRCEGRAR